MFSQVSVCPRGVSAPLHAGIHPPGADIPPGEDTHPLGADPPPSPRMLGDMGNKREVRILLECILVLTVD